MAVIETNTDAVTLSEALSSTLIKTTNISEMLVLSEAFNPNYKVTLKDIIPVLEQLLQFSDKPYSGKIKYKFRCMVNGAEVKLTKFLITRRLQSVSEFTGDVLTGFVSIGDSLDFYWTTPDNQELLIFTGEVVAVTYIERSATYRITAKGVEYKLERDIYATVDTSTNTVNGVFRYDNTRADVIAKNILYDTGFTLVECPTDIISVKFDFISRWKALSILADLLGVNLWVDTGKGVHLGINVSSYDNYSAILKQEQTANSTGAVNRVIVIGGVKPDGSIPIGVVQDGSDIASNGVKAKVIKLPQVQDSKTAKKVAEVYLNRFSYYSKEVVLRLALTPNNIRLREGDILTLNGVEYQLSKITYGPEYIRAMATLSIPLPDLSDYINNAVNNSEQNSISSDFKSSTYVSFVIYENIELAPDPDGDGVSETITIDGVDYTIIGVMHFYTPDGFTAKDITLYARQFSDTIENWAVALNGTLLTPETVTGDDGKSRYKVVIPPDLIIQGWNDLFFIESGGG